MARNKGTFKFAANFEVKLQGLLDPRGGVTNKSELINKETFPYDGDTIYMQEGMLVTVSATQEVYMLVSLANILAEDYSGWKRIDAGGVTQLEVIDNLTTADSTKALSAGQGKALNDRLTLAETKLTAVYTYKGTKTSYSELPTDAQTGDVWNVIEAYNTNPAGTNWAWNGTEWDALGGEVDLSDYATNDFVQTTKEEIDGQINTINVSITNLETEIQNVNDRVDTQGTQINSITKNIGEINELNTAQNERLTTLEQLVTGGEGGEGGSTLLEMVSANTQAISDLTKRVEANESAISTLTSDASVEGSVDNKIESALTWEDIV